MPGLSGKIGAMPVLASTTLLCFVFAVSDGDTLKARCADPATGIETTQVVRLAGIDAPEHGQPYGQRAKTSLAEMTLHKPARLQCREKPDRYGRSLCTAWVTPASCTQRGCEFTLDANLAMLTLGLAWWPAQFAREQPPQQRGQYEFAQDEAKAKRVGLWREGGKAVPPWEWRREHPGWPHARAAAGDGATTAQ